MKLNQSGVILLDFIFALILSMGVMSLLYAICLTLSMAEVAQYIAFASSRAHSAANLNQESQEAAARTKYEELISTPALKSIFSGSWFSLSKTSELEIRGGGPSGASFDSEYSNNEGGREVPFHGVRLNFIAHVLNMKVPFLGRATDEDDGFATKITGFIIREPTLEECLNFMRSRQAALRNLDARFTSLLIKDDQYVAMEDNGC